MSGTDAGFGGQNMVGRLRRVLLRTPDAAFGDADPVRWHYTSRPDLAKAESEHAALAGLIANDGVEVILHEEALPDHADAIYVFDPTLITDAGAVLLGMGKTLRRGEEAALGRKLQELGVPLLGSLTGDERAEGGDILWLDDHTLALGLGFRSNRAGLLKLQSLLRPAGIDVLPFELPYYQGPEACLHLLSLISLVDRDLAVAYPELMPTSFWQELRKRGLRLIEVPEEEFLTMGTNILALAPGRCLALAGNPRTREMLEAAGVEVLTYVGEQISLKAEGGPTCLTRPLLRDP